MGEYLAHYDEAGNIQTLKSHIEGVADLAVREGDKLGIGHIMQIITLSHDIGKFSDDFQQYLREAVEEGRREDVNHSSAGAEIWMSKYIGAAGQESIKAFLEMICYTISAHHGMYDLISREEEDIFERRLQAIGEEELKIVFEGWREELDITSSRMNEMLDMAWREYKDVFLKEFIEESGKNSAEYFFYIGCFERLLLSMQIDADWTDTAGAMDEGEKEEILTPKEVYEQAWDNYGLYMQKLQQKAEVKASTEKERKINGIRSQIQEECLDFTRYDTGIYCLPIPTGAGKTLTSLGYALKFAKEHLGNKDEVERIFYISPYISITEQNAQVIKEAVGNPEWVLEHHSNVVNSDDKEWNIETSWEERIISTTMVQFLNTLFSDRKKCIRRFHKLKNSIVILDEIQSLPVKAIHTFNLMINFLNRICHTNLILCTATQPMLDAPCVKRKIRYSEPRNMIADLNLKFEQFERVQIEAKLSGSKDTIDSLAEQIKKEFLRVRSVLVIFNKKKPVADLFDKMKQELRDIDTFYLTTNLCAEHRSDIIGRIKEILKLTGRKILIISTNLIEAGIDLSVECVYRSLTGIDSIAQAAGRCNRNGELERGIVKIFELAGDEPGRNMEELLTAQQKTREILYRHSQSGKSQSIIFPDWMQQYYDVFYEALKGKMDFPLSGEYQSETIFGLLSTGFSEIKASHVLRQAFRTAGAQYEVIADTGVTVLVPYKDGAHMIGQLEQSTERRDIRSCLKKLQRYTVSVFDYKKEELLGKGVIRECSVLPDVYIALGYEEEKGLSDVMPDAIF